MRVPTYAHYMNLAAGINSNRANVDKYSFQSVSGLKHQTYSGYGMSAYNIVSMESTLAVTNTFMENNKLANIALNTSNLAIETITDALTDLKNVLGDFYGTDLSRISPDYTGGELTFTDDNINTYIGKTLTVKGTTYKFATDDADTNNINIAGKTSAEEIMQAIADKVSDAEFVYKNGKLSFPLYSIDGESTALTQDPAKSAIVTGKVHTMDSEHYLAMQNMQMLAFSTMQLIADTLNTNVGGKYIYGGGSTSAPVDFDFARLEDFQTYYDGVTTIFPSTSSAVLSNFSVDASLTGDVSFSLVAGEKNSGVITASSGTFVKSAIVMNAANVGTVTFDSGANTMVATEYGAYSSLHAGDTIVINGSNSALGTNAKAYVIRSVSADGRTVTFEDSTPVAQSVTIAPDGDVVVNKTFPLGSVINLEGFNDKNLAPTATVTGISDDGTQLYVKVDETRFPSTSSAGNNRWSITAQSYYTGGSLEYNQRISESQTISFDVKAGDPAFEKIFRALGQICQGNLVDTSHPEAGEAFNPLKTKQIIEEALSLISSATSGTGDITQAPNSSLYSITAKINADYTILNKVMDNQQLAVNNLENNIGSLKDADKDEAAVKLLLAEGALEASYSILSSVSKLTLLDYIK